MFFGKAKNGEGKTHDYRITPKITDSENIDFIKLRKLARRFVSEVKLAEDKDLFFIVGPTGSGKSSLVNYLLGHGLKLEELLVSDADGNERIEKRAIISKAFERQKQAPIGNSYVSGTPFPQLYETICQTQNAQNSDLIFVDCPGFDGVRVEKAERIFESLSMQMAINAARSIQALIVVIDYNALEMQKGVLLKKLSAILGKFILKPHDIADSILFVFTHIEEKRLLLDAKPFTQQKIIINKIKAFIDLYEKQKKNKKNDDIEKILNILYLIQGKYLDQGSTDAEEKYHIGLVNVFDDGRCREALLKRLRQIKKTSSSIPKEYFSFRRYDEEYLQFEKSVFSLVEKGGIKIQEKIKKAFSYSQTYEKNRERINFYKLEIDRCWQKIASFEQEIANEIKQKEDILQRKIENLNNAIEKKKLTLLQVKENIDELERRYETKLDKLHELDTDEPILWYSEKLKQKFSSHIEKRFLSGVAKGTGVALATGGSITGGITLIGTLSSGLVGFVGGAFIGGVFTTLTTPAAGLIGGLASSLSGNHILKTFKYDKKIPLSKVEYSGAGTWIEAKDNDIAQAKYMVTYKSDYMQDGKAKISYYVTKKNYPENAEEIKILHSRLKALRQIIEQKNLEKNDLENLIKDDHKQIVTFQENSNLAIIRIQNVCMKEIQQFRKQLELQVRDKNALAKRQDELIQEIKKCKSITDEEKSLYETIIELARYLDCGKEEKLLNFSKVYENFTQMTQLQTSANLPFLQK